MKNPTLLPLRRAALVALILLSAVPVRAQFTNKISTTPVLIQDGFGPSGDALPFGGQEYCCPTAASVSLDYLGVNGFNQLAPLNPASSDELNLNEIMAGLMNTSATTGTATVSNITSAISAYLSAKGIGSSNYTLSTLSAPTIAQLTTLNQSGTVVDLICGYYDPSGNTYIRNGGHDVALLNESITAGGQPSPNTLVINNPLPGAFEPAADASSNSLQSINTTPTTGALTSFGSLVLDPTQFPGFWGTTRTVVETAIALTVNPNQESSNNPTPSTWTLSATQSLNPDGGDFSVLAPIQSSGSFGISISTPGTVDLQNTDTSTGANTISAGTLRSDISTGSPFGSGAITLSAGTLDLSPSGSSNATFSAANSSGSQLTYAGGSTIDLNRNTNNSLSLTIGGNTSGTTPNLVRSGNGTLVIAPSDGTANLGISEDLVIAGSAANLPTVTNGIVSPSIIGENNDANSSGDFLTYGSSGFAKASYTESSVTPITSANSTTIFDAETAQTIPASTTASVYAIKVGPVAVTGGASSTLNVGPQSTGQAGVILNGGTISSTNLNFGSSEGLIYASAAGGIINSAIQNTGGLATFGPGTLTLTSPSTFTGGTHINSGILAADNSTGSITGSGAVNVNQNATLELLGPSGEAGGAGGTTISSGGTVLLAGGTLKGPANFNSGSFLLGSGTITGTTTVSGTIGSPATDFPLTISLVAPYTGVENIAFTGAVTMNSSTIYDWRLNSLDANPSDAGIDWSLLSFTSNSTINMGTSGNAINVTLDLASGLPSADTGNAFWSTSHQWDIATDPHGFNNIWYHWNFPTYSQGYFSLSLDTAVDNLYVDYTAVPEPTAISAFTILSLLTLRPRRI